jgi:hypothetical protein
MDEEAFEKRAKKPAAVMRPLDPDDPRNPYHPCHEEKWLELARAIGRQMARADYEAWYNSTFCTNNRDP